MADPWVIAAMLDDFRKCPRCQTWELADCEAGLGCNPMTKEQRQARYERLFSMPTNNPKQPEVTEEDEKVWLNIIACSVTDPKRSHRMLARHRIATRERVLEEAARFIENRYCRRDVVDVTKLAAAIRAMKEEPK